MCAFKLARLLQGVYEESWQGRLDQKGSPPNLIVVIFPEGGNVIYSAVKKWAAIYLPSFVCCRASPICSANGKMKIWGMMYTLRKNIVVLFIHVDIWMDFRDYLSHPNRTRIAFQNQASVSIVRATVSQVCRLWSSPIITIKFDQIWKFCFYILLLAIFPTESVRNI